MVLGHRLNVGNLCLQELDFKLPDRARCRVIKRGNFQEFKIMQETLNCEKTQGSHSGTKPKMLCNDQLYKKKQYFDIFYALCGYGIQKLPICATFFFTNYQLIKLKQFFKKMLLLILILILKGFKLTMFKIWENVEDIFRK